MAPIDMIPIDRISRKDPLDSGIAAQILSRCKDRDTFFVFPTQAAANTWARAVIASPEIPSVETDRFIGWDVFLERLTQESVPEGKEKSDTRSRLFWALHVLSEHGDKPSFESLFKPGLPPTLSHATFLARIAPALKDFSAAVRSAHNDGALREVSGEVADFLTLAEKYSRFLEANNLYEQSHLAPREIKDRRYIIFEPSLIPDYEKYAKFLKVSGTVKDFSMHGAEAARNAENRPTALKFATFRQELVWVFSTCEKLLEDGLQPDDIAISMPALTPETKAHVGRIADLYAVPIAFRSGEPLAASPFGRLLRALSQAGEEGFSLQTLKKLLGEKAFEWKDPLSARKLLRFAEKYHIPEFSADRHYMSLLWNRTFALCGRDEEGPRLFFDELRKAAGAIAGARSFSTLRMALHDFRATFLDESTLSPLAQLTLERIFDEIEALDAWHARLGGQDLSPAPFRILLLILDSTRYNPAVKANAISLYSYQTGMLTASAIHFVLDVSQESTAGFQDRYSDFPEELRPYLGNISEYDEHLLDSFNAVNAVYCHAEQGLSGYSVLHPYFALKKARLVPRGDDKGTFPESPEARETQAWLDGNADRLPSQLLKHQKEAALGSFRRHDDSASLFPPPIFIGKGPARAAVMDNAESLSGLQSCTEGPLIKFTPARLKDYSLCPFRWLMFCVLDAEKSDSSYINLAEGTFSHSVIRGLLGDISRRDGSVKSENNEIYTAMLDDSIGKNLLPLLRKYGPSIEPAIVSAVPKIKSRMERLLEFEADFEEKGWDIGVFEVQLSRLYEDMGVILEGRADRICEKSSSRTAEGPASSDERFAIIDYKKKNTPQKREFLADKDGRLHDFQLAGYAEMLSGEGKEVELAMYWSIDECRAAIVFGSGGARKSREEFEPERKIFLDTLSSAALSIRSGKFMTILRSNEACAPCPWKPVCRAYFSAEHV